VTHAGRPSHRIPTRLLLQGGVVGPVVFVVAILIEGATRPGYDPVRQFVSVLSLGDGGWVQAANFVVSGLLIVGLGVGSSRLARDADRRWVARMLTVAGLAFAWSGLFSTDPQWGYPVWISAYAAANPTWHSDLHYIGGFVAATALPLAIVVEARRAWCAADRQRALYSLASAAVMAGCFLMGLAVGGPAAQFAWGGLLQRASLIAGMQWLASLAIAQLRSEGRRAPAVRQRRDVIGGLTAR
jgi:Protein of unknown function (DUF998)